MLEIIFLIIGLLGLVLGAELVIKGALNIGEHFKISHLFLGLTVLAIGTDLPELVLHITGAIHRVRGVATGGLVSGDTIGSCFGQIGLTLGILGLVGTLVLTKRELIRDGLLMVGSVVLLYLVSLDGKISRADGILFILIYLFYFFTLHREEKLREREKRAPSMHLAWDISSLVAGFALLIYFSNMVVKNAVLMAEIWGIAQSFIGIVIVGLGTSLPEIAVTFGAIKKKAYRLSVGNLIGSNIFDTLVPLGIGSAIAGFAVERNLLDFDIPALFFLSIIVLLFFKRKMKIRKEEAVALVLIYLAYIAIKIAGIY